MLACTLTRFVLTDFKGSGTNLVLSLRTFIQKGEVGPSTSIIPQLRVAPKPDLLSLLTRRRAIVRACRIGRAGGPPSKQSRPPRVASSRKIIHSRRNEEEESRWAD